MRGIRVVSGHPAAISILTTYAARPDDRPYDDDIGPDGYPRYKWRGTDAHLYDNVALRTAMELRKPLAWFIGTAPGVYEAIFPVWIVAEEPEHHQFVVALDSAMESSWQPDIHASVPDDVRRREYALDVVRRRLHQPLFRGRVLAAYGRQCALCRHRHPELSTQPISGKTRRRRTDCSQWHRDVRDPPPSLRCSRRRCDTRVSHRGSS